MISVSPWIDPKTSFCHVQGQGLSSVFQPTQKSQVNSILVSRDSALSLDDTNYRFSLVFQRTIEGVSEEVFMVKNKVLPKENPIELLAGSYFIMDPTDSLLAEPFAGVFDFFLFISFNSFKEYANDPTP